MANGSNANTGSKGLSSMQVQLRRRFSLLSRASTLAIIAAAGGLGSAQQAQAACVTPVVVNDATSQPITSNAECIHVNSEITHDVVN